MANDVEKYSTFKDWLVGELEADTLRDLARYGAAGGFGGLTYYRDTCALYEAYDDEIWNWAEEQARDFGYKNVFALIATWGGVEQMECRTGFENGMVWAYAEAHAEECADLREEKENEEAANEIEAKADDYTCGLTREEIIAELHAIGIACYVNETTEELREAVKANIIDGTISI